MERLSIAISKARETSAQLRQGQPQTAMGGASPPPGAATAAGHADGKPWYLTLAVPLLLGLAAVMAFWAMRSGPGAMSESAAAQVEPPPAQQVAMLTTPPPPLAKPVDPAGANSVVPVSAEVPAAAGVIEPDKPPVSVNDQVATAVEVWRQAWSTRDMNTYLGSYSEAFKPPAGLSREEWIASRYRNVGGRKSIDVQIKDLQVLTVEDGRARVRFLQDYTSDSFRETEQPKTLDLVRDADDQWRIAGEWQGNPPPFSEPGKS
jgi:hypothetical protein